MGRPGQAGRGRGAADLSFRATAKRVGAVNDGDRLEALSTSTAKAAVPSRSTPGQVPRPAAYQGVVPLHGDQREPLQKISEVLEHYMLQSEQLDTRLVLAANGEIAAGALDPTSAHRGRRQSGRAAQ